jgi:hypothetical protein
METAPKDRPIIAICGGVEMAVMWEPILECWLYWDEEDNEPGYERVKSQITGWRALF